jgi:hypothetical protein
MPVRSPCPIIHRGTFKQQHGQIVIHEHPVSPQFSDNLLKSLEWPGGNVPCQLPFESSPTEMLAITYPYIQ